MKEGVDQKKISKCFTKWHHFHFLCDRPKRMEEGRKKTFLFFDRLSPRILSFSFVVAVFSGGEDADGTKGNMEALSTRTIFLLKY